MKRYEIIQQWHTTMWEAKEGDWVKHEDVKKLVRNLLNVYSEMTFEISDEEIEEYINSDILEGMVKHRPEGFHGGL